MRAVVFYSIIKSIEENTLTREQVKTLKAYSLNNVESLILADVLLKNAKKYLFESVLVRGELDFSKLKFGKYNSPKIVNFFNEIADQVFLPYRHPEKRFSNELKKG